MVGGGCGDRYAPAAGAEQERVACGDEEVFGHPARLVAGGEQFAERDQRARGVFVGDRVEDVDPQRERGRAEQCGDGGRVEPAVSAGDRLIEQRLRVARRAAGGRGDRLERGGVELDPLALEQVGEARLDLVGGEQAELEVLGARPDGREHLLGVGGRQYEDDVLGWFLDALEQRVRRLLGEHVDLVEDVHRAAPAEALMGELLAQLSGVVDLAFRRGVDFEEVEEGARRDGATVLTLAARLAVLTEVRAVQSLRQDAGRAGLAGAAGSREQVRVSDPVVTHRVAKGVGDGLLAAQLGEALRPVLAVEGLVGHGRTVPTETDRAAPISPAGVRTVHPPSTRPLPEAAPGGGSGQACLRHTGQSAESCFLPDLTRFARSRCAGPDPQHRHTGPLEQRPEPRAGVQPPIRGLGVQGTTSSPPSTVRAGRLAPVPTMPSSGRDARADESARLESVCGATHRGFESHSLRPPASAVALGLARPSGGGRRRWILDP